MITFKEIPVPKNREHEIWRAFLVKSDTGILPHRNNLRNSIDKFAQKNFRISNNSWAKKTHEKPEYTVRISDRETLLFMVPPSEKEKEITERIKKEKSNPRPQDKAISVIERYNQIVPFSVAKECAIILSDEMIAGSKNAFRRAFWD